MRVNNWLSGFACVLLLGVVGCKKDKIREGIPVVVEKVGVDDVEIFGDYVGRIRARQFVEVHARVEGYLEKMLFEEGKRVERNQPLFIINPDLYKARADKAAAQLKKDEAQELKTGRDVERLRPLYEQNAANTVTEESYRAAHDDLCSHYKEIQTKLATLQKQRDKMNADAIAIGGMMFELSELDDLPLTFNEKLWQGTVDHVTVYADERVVFRFKDGKEVKTRL